MEQFPEAHKPGYAVYSRKSLAIYDALVLGLSNSLIWRCASKHLVDLYSRHLTADHLDIGVGTGYFLDKAVFPVAQPKITLLDPNAECLEAAAARISRYQPRTVQADALIPWPETLGRFQSVGLNYVFHCLPGTMTEKTVLLDHLKPHLAPGGTVFGSTILQGDAPRSWIARKLMAVYNSKGVFSNEDDTRDTLEAALALRFEEVRIEMIGCVALFSAR
ncbi:class I SAM-dependent methyltransferase [Roseibium sediminicola]|uniref:Class I SAM-dependent methyltransferase n=1 Tax=Roseibium sediminicola TaxID=2933272 RepID=A0ABT0GNL9_9HYPH|nr:class I SAM-dependent methyltransferase [Roseibium sp. CAU 1639]MCK7611013.1 class I SAM-dependent methyltransferase [Roseibium sp. CAU 1639]